MKPPQTLSDHLQHSEAQVASANVEKFVGENGIEEIQVIFAFNGDTPASGRT